jgi:hypothetical protein
MSEIVSAYRDRSKEFHSDVSQDDGEAMYRLNEAIGVLRDGHKRANYNQQRGYPPPPRETVASQALAVYRSRLPARRPRPSPNVRARRFSYRWAAVFGVAILVVITVIAVRSSDEVLYPEPTLPTTSRPLDTAQLDLVRHHIPPDASDCKDPHEPQLLTDGSHLIVAVVCNWEGRSVRFTSFRTAGLLRDRFAHVAERWGEDSRFGSGADVPTRCGRRFLPSQARVNHTRMPVHPISYYFDLVDPSLLVFHLKWTIGTTIIAEMDANAENLDAACTWFAKYGRI